MLTRKAAVPRKTVEDTEWCLQVWKDWSEERNKRCVEQVPVYGQLCSVTGETLSLWLENAANTLHHLVCGIMRHARTMHPDIHVDFFQDPEFVNLKKTLDGEMKRIQAKGVGTHVKQAEPITEEEEEQMWSKGVLGEHTPQALLNTIFFMCGMCLALRNGSEHRNLRLSPP